MGNDAKIIGLNIRQEPNGKSPKLGLLPRDARIELGANSQDGKWARIKRVLKGEIAPVQQGGAVNPAAATGWVFVGELDPGPADPEALDEIVVPSKPVPIRAGELIGDLGEYQQFPDAQPTPQRGWRPLLHLEVFSGDDVPAFIEQSRSYAKTLPAGSGTLLVIDKGAKLVTPSKADGELPATERLILLADAPPSGAWTKVKRAALQVVEKVKLGAYNSSTKTYANGALWTGWYVGVRDDQRTQDEATATRLGYTRREVQVPIGEPLWIERSALSPSSSQVPVGGKPIRTWNSFPLRVANAQEPAAGFARVMTRAELERVPANDRATDPEGNTWWRVTVRREVADKAHPGPKGQNVDVGWVCEKGHDKVSWQSPWAWSGFELVEEGDIQPIDMWSTALYRIGWNTKEEVTDFKARADKVDKSELLQKLYEHIDTNEDGVFSPNELQDSLKQPLLAQAMSRIIVKYESEWGGNEAKWDELDALVLEGKPEWQAEKLRIKSLRWWPKVAAKVKGFPSSPLVFHFHPIGLINSFHAVSGGGPSASSSDRANTSTSGGPMEKSGKEWVKRFPKSDKLSDLKQPFQSSVSRFFDALVAGGIKPEINTTLRAPQRSYLMYYARKIAKSKIQPGKVPPFEPRNGDAPVNIDWAHRDSNGKPDLVAAKKAAIEMDTEYAARKAIGKAYSSNHNGGEAIDVAFKPDWGIGKSVVDANGKTVAINSKKDLLKVGATYGVYHWDYYGIDRDEDDPHWSKTGN